MKLYFKYRYDYYNQAQGRYSLSYKYEQQRKWYVNHGVKIFDMEVPDDKYDTEASRDRIFWYVEFDESVVSYSDLAWDLEKYYPDYSIAVITPEQAKTFLRNFTTCVESEQWFLTVPAHKNMDGVDVPDKFITIE